MNYLLITFIRIQQAFAAPGGGSIPQPPSGGGGITQPAPSGGGGVFQLPNPLRYSKIEDVLDKVANGLIIIAVPLITIMILWGAFQILFSGGDEEKFKTGKRTIVYALIGAAIVAVAKGFSALITELLR